MSQKMLIIGGNSLVGSTLSEYASSHFDIHLTNRENLKTQTKFSVTKIDLINQRSEITSLINTLNPEVVVHTVAHTVNFCESNRDLADLLHVDITKEIAQACKNTGSKLIFFSTDAVFDGSLNRKFRETDKPNPISYYAKTKLKGEKIVSQASDLNVVLRTTVIYGWHPHSRFTNWVINSLKDKKTVAAFTDQRNTPTLVDDLVKSILIIIEKKLGGLYHAVGNTCLSRYEFAEKIAEKFELDKSLIKPTISSKNQKVPRPANGCLDNNKLKKRTGYDFCDIESGLSFILRKSHKNS